MAHGHGKVLTAAPHVQGRAIARRVVGNQPVVAPVGDAGQVAACRPQQRRLVLVPIRPLGGSDCRRQQRQTIVRSVDVLQLSLCLLDGALHVRRARRRFHRRYVAHQAASLFDKSLGLVLQQLTTAP